MHLSSKDISSYFKNQRILVSGIPFYGSGERRGEKNHSREDNFIGQSIMAIELVGGVFLCF